MNQPLNEKLEYTLVTGATGGMGKSLVFKLLELGEHVLATSHDFNELESHFSHFGTLCTRIPANFSDPAFIDIFPGNVKLKGFVHLAGVSIGDRIETISRTDWDNSFLINVTSALVILQKYYHSFVEKASIVFVSSPVSIIGARKVSYAASKAALNGLAITCAKELAPNGIRVNTILPGTCLTNMTADWDEKKQRKVAQQNLQNRLFEPDESAQQILYLLSDQSSAITGSTIDMTSGAMWRI